MNDIAIYGAGGFGREVALMIHQINRNIPQWNLIGFFDDGLEKGNLIDGLMVLGGITEVNSWSSDLSIAIAVADPIIRIGIRERITNKVIDFPTLIHPEANTGDMQRNFFGVGCIIAAGVIFTTSVTIEDFVIINLSVTVGHDVHIGKFTTVMPGCNISGNVKIGEVSLLGAGSCVLQQISIGYACKIGAGAVVTRSFEGNQILVGVPARARL